MRSSYYKTIKTKNVIKKMTYPPCQICGKECLIECKCSENLTKLTRAGQRLLKGKGFTRKDAKMLFRQYFKSEYFGKPSEFLKTINYLWRK